VRFRRSTSAKDLRTRTSESRGTEVQPIGRIRVGFEVTDGDSSGGGEEECRRASGRRGGGLES
jgi:hypothetical protein